MNGLLHRVAARAAGTAVAVRSDAGLAYAGGGLVSDDIGEAAPPLPTAAASRSQMPPAAVDRVHDLATRPVVPPNDANTVNDVNTAGAPSVPTPSVSVAAQPDAPLVRHTPAPAAAISQTTLSRPEPTQASDFDAPPPTMPSLQSAPPRSHPVLAPLEAESLAAAAHTATELDDPAPLMPRAARPALLSPVTPPSVRHVGLPQASTTAPGEDNTEVHIHIGRIDVTAVHEAPPPRRRAAAAPAPMSLDSYLAQRGRS